MTAISVSRLSRYFRIYQKGAGIRGSIASLFRRKYTTAKAVDDISFSIEEGELVGFIGQNGAGKTTTLKCLSGLMYPTRGEVSVLGYTPFDRKTDFLKQIGLVMGQKNQLWWDLPPMESYLLNKEIYAIPGDRFKKTLGDLVDLMGIADIIGVQVRKLSLGQRMKCELIAQLLHGPRVLFLDEPTIGLDVVMQQRLRDFIRDYNKKTNATIILTSHYMQDVKELCRRVIIIDHGKLAYDGALSDITRAYSDRKILTVVFGKPVEKHVLAKLGEVKLFELPKARILVSRARTNAVAQELLRDFPIEDITIEEPGIEEVVRRIFSSHHA